MTIRIRYIVQIKRVLLAIVTLLATVALTTVAAEADSKQVKTNLQDKYYRQALYHYFQHDNVQALTDIDRSKAKLTTLDSRSSLFEAGLQLSAGLLQQAKNTLVNFDELLIREKEHQNKQHKSAKANELRLVALLSLTEQYLQQGNMTQAQDTLSKINVVSANYYPQYHILSQLAYWPEKVALIEVTSSTNNDAIISSPYVQLNDALLLIQRAKEDPQAATANFEQAITLLHNIKATPWHKKEDTFWQQLFLNEDSTSNKQHMAMIQGQAIQDYAQLLLVQIYISQERYTLAFKALKTFPEQSPYTDSALFLFAFASQQVQQYDLAYNLLNVLYKKSPYSTLAWQSAELMAEQVSEQQSLAQGVSVYQSVERFFVERQQSLMDFTNAFQQSSNLLEFSIAAQSTPVLDKSSYKTDSVWLQQALYNAELSSLYQHLLSIDKLTHELNRLASKASWLAEIIALNQERKQKVLAVKANRHYNDIVTKITTERDRLSTILAEELVIQSHQKFANNDEEKWLARIARSQDALTRIQTLDHNKNLGDYQQRLARVKGVLSWQLSRQYPERAWQHTKQLKQLDQAIVSMTLQQQKLADASKNDQNLTASIAKQEASVKQLALLLLQASELRDKITAKIHGKVNDYVEQQNSILTSHLLSTRQGMARVLEKMDQVDKTFFRKTQARKTAVKTVGEN